MNTSLESLQKAADALDFVVSDLTTAHASACGSSPLLAELLLPELAQAVALRARVVYLLALAR